MTENSTKVCAGYLTSASILAGFDIKERQVDDYIQRLTHIIYHSITVNKGGELQFPKDFISNVDDEGNVYGTCEALFYYKKKYRHLKSVMSILCDTILLSLVLNDDEKTDLLIGHIVSTIRDYGFDGVMFYINAFRSNTEVNNIGKFIYTLHSVLESIQFLHSHESDFIISMSVDLVPQRLLLLDNDVIERYIDFIEVRGYELNGPWNKKVSYHSNLYNIAITNTINTDLEANQQIHSLNCINDSIEVLKKQGMDISKIVIGTPMYGHGYIKNYDIGCNVQESQNKSYRIYYKYLPIGEEKQDKIYMSSYCSSDILNTIITYESTDSIHKKTMYIQENNMGGICLNHIACDKFIQEHSLIEKAYTTLEDTLKKELNIIRFETSQYKNIATT